MPQDLLACLTRTLREHAWVWDLVVKKHLAELCQHPAAASMLVGAVTRLEGQQQGWAYSVLTGQLRRAGPAARAAWAAGGMPSSTASAPLLPEVQALLFSQLQHSFRVVSHALIPGFELHQPQHAQHGQQLSRVDVLLHPQLPAQLQLQLQLLLGSGDGAQNPLRTAVLVSVLMLVGRLSSAEGLLDALQLQPPTPPRGGTADERWATARPSGAPNHHYQQQQAKHGKQQQGEHVQLRGQEAQRVLTALSLLAVLMEALVNVPQLRAVIGGRQLHEWQPHEEPSQQAAGGAVEGGEAWCGGGGAWLKPEPLDEGGGADGGWGGPASTAGPAGSRACCGNEEGVEERAALAQVERAELVQTVAMLAALHWELYKVCGSGVGIWVCGLPLRHLGCQLAVPVTLLSPSALKYL
jgi:hypothetical protein